MIIQCITNLHCAREAAWKCFFFVVVLSSGECRNSFAVRLLDSTQRLSGE